MLGEHVERALHWQSRFEQALLHTIARGGDFDELQRVGRCAGDAARRARTVSASSRSLKESRDAFRAADLQYAIDGREVHPEVE